MLDICIFSIKAHALNISPEKYGRKAKTQRKWREFRTAVDHVV